MKILEIPTEPVMPKKRSSPVVPRIDPSAMAAGPIEPREMLAASKASKKVVPAPSVQTIVDQVATAITPSLGLRARGDGTGDCTTFAIELASRLETAGIPARLVTGFVLDGGKLWPHRWVAIVAGGRWVGLDAARGEAPTGADHVAVRTHAADPAARWAGSAALATIRTARWTQ